MSPRLGLSKGDENDLDRAGFYWFHQNIRDMHALRHHEYCLSDWHSFVLAPLDSNFFEHNDDLDSRQDSRPRPDPARPGSC